MELSCRGQGLSAQRTEGVSHQQPPLKEISEEEICEEQYQNSVKLFPEKPGGEKRRIRKPNNEERIGKPIQEGN